METKLKGGVIGAGIFGGYHADKYTDNEHITLVAIYDIDLGRAKKLAVKHAAKAFDDLDMFLSEVDVVTVASPATAHFKNAQAALLAGKSVLVEKPIATRVAEADALITLAEKQKCVLAVGHQERVVFDAMGLFDVPETPIRIEAERMGGWSGRGADVSVTLDLLIHDADLVITLLKTSHHKSIDAQAKCVHTELPDEITADIIFENGATAKLQASRNAENRKRNMRIEYPSGIVEIDFMNRTFSNTTPFDLNENFADTPQGKDPLAANFERFIDAVNRRDSLPAVRGISARRALKLALAIDESAGL